MLTIRAISKTGRIRALDKCKPSSLGYTPGDESPMLLYYSQGPTSDFMKALDEKAERLAKSSRVLQPFPVFSQKRF